MLCGIADLRMIGRVPFQGFFRVFWEMAFFDMYFYVFNQILKGNIAKKIFLYVFPDV
jgi:hypothetical protein